MPAIGALGEGVRVRDVEENEGAGAVPLVITRLHRGLLVALPVADVVSVELEGAVNVRLTPRMDVTSTGVEAADLSEVLRWPWGEPAPASRCTLVLRARGDLLRVKGGPRAWVTSVPPGRIRPVPKFLAGLQVHGAVGALFRGAKEWGLLLHSALLPRAIVGAGGEGQAKSGDA